MSGVLIQFVNCKVLRQHKFINEDLWVRDGTVIDPEKIFFDEQIQADKKIDCGGDFIVPGFIELQINGKYFGGFKCKHFDKGNLFTTLLT